MSRFVYEDDIEKALLHKLAAEPFGYDIIQCDSSPDKKEVLPDGTGRTDKKQCLLPDILRASLLRFNPDIPADKVESVYKDLLRDAGSQDLVAANYKRYNQIRNGVQVSFKKNGKEDFGIVRLIDFEKPENNTFTAVSQMWIQGRYYWHRPDVLLYVNGLPLVFIELKNSDVKVETAYSVNLKRYIGDVPNLFTYNQVCVLSNGLETKLGAFNATYDYFFEWLKGSEEDKIDRKAIYEDGVSIVYFADGLLKKESLIDYIENFVLFENQATKIIAKNHQYLGVNNLIESVRRREELQGKLGVFWHTQGSGKSYSMVMFTRKVKRKIPGNFTFLIITDREDLDTQIHKNFVRTEMIGAKEECQPKNGEQLRQYLQSNKPFIFTLIHKFNYDKGKKYPVLSTRNDIFVLADEAHRTQYKALAENMRTALPNANYIAFTGTPLLGAKRLTNRWFGDYVSEYNFAQSVEDGSTVPLFYSRRVPEVWLQNDFLDDDVLEIIEDENLNEAETRLLENSSSRILEVIKRDNRLDKIARDIAHHFPRRGFLGKGMAVSVDKYTAVKMYDKVQHYWELEKQSIIQERNAADTAEKRKELTRILNYMNDVEMAVVVSEEADEKDKFAKQGLNIVPHRDKMNYITPEGVDIEDRFKNPTDNLQLVFVCAMWLTGFDVKSLSTVYLDKPMKGHTLMQAIARANRVFPNKPCGIIVDYVNVFKYMKKALSDYATGDDGEELPAKNIDQLIQNLDDCIEETDKFLRENGIVLDEIIAEASTFDKLEDLRAAYNKLIATDDTKNRFKVLVGTAFNLYEAAKPEIFEKDWYNEKFSPISYLHGLFFNYIDDDKINRARRKMAQVLDSSISSAEAEGDPKLVIHGTKIIDLSKIDVDQLRQEIKKTPYKAIEIEDLKKFLEEALEKLLNKNCTRIKFSDRYKGIVDRYNAGGSENEDYYEQLVKLIEDLKKEQARAELEGLTEEELELYDLLIKGKKLSQAEEQKVKLAAKNLFKKLTTDKKTLLVVDWYKDEQPIARVKTAIQQSLNDDLPDCYDRESFLAKTQLLLNHFIDMAVQGYGWVA